MCPTEVCQFLRDYLARYFVRTNQEYDGAVGFNLEHPEIAPLANNPQRVSVKVHRLAQQAAIERFPEMNLRGEFAIEETNLKGDLWDSDSQILYELSLGQGDDFWKNLIKALLLQASKLVILARRYPDLAARGYEDIRGWIDGPARILLERIQIDMEVHVIEIIPEQ